MKKLKKRYVVIGVIVTILLFFLTPGIPDDIILGGFLTLNQLLGK